MNNIYFHSIDIKLINNNKLTISIVNFNNYLIHIQNLAFRKNKMNNNIMLK